LEYLASPLDPRMANLTMRTRLPNLRARGFAKR
jgi:hypothetical protein